MEQPITAHKAGDRHRPDGRGRRDRDHRRRARRDQGLPTCAPLGRTAERLRGRRCRPLATGSRWRTAAAPCCVGPPCGSGSASRWSVTALGPLAPSGTAGLAGTLRAAWRHRLLDGAGLLGVVGHRLGVGTGVESEVVAGPRLGRRGRTGLRHGAGPGSGVGAGSGMGAGPGSGTGAARLGDGARAGSGRLGPGSLLGRQAQLLAQRVCRPCRSAPRTCRRCARRRGPRPCRWPLRLLGLPLTKSLTLSMQAAGHCFVPRFALGSEEPEPCAAAGHFSAPYTRRGHPARGRARAASPG